MAVSGFQFTHPGRGATAVVITSLISICVSIHAPREGCDAKFAGMDPCINSFNSRTPGGVRRKRTLQMLMLYVFQFTHPGRGATPLHRGKYLLRDVSIHAPREGCDLPRLHHRLLLLQFQFTHPGRGATQTTYTRGRMNLFQFTHPGRGATSICLSKIFLHLSFNSRTPGGVRQGSSDDFRDINLSFNSRTPGGVRHFIRQNPSKVRRFNSRTPGGVRPHPNLDRDN